MNYRVFGALFLAMPLWGADCHCPALTPEEQQDQATYVFTGRVMDAGTNRETEKREVLFDVQDTYKGAPESEMTVVDTLGGGPCELAVKEEETYVVFARWDWGSVITSQCAGTKKLDAGTDPRRLGPSDALKEKFFDRIQAQCMGKKTTGCCLESLKAMRKGRYLLEPESGCYPGTAPDRLACAGSLRWCVPVSEAPAPRPTK
jgi:hypothetical protein